MTTLTWTGFAQDGNPNNPKNWNPEGIPNVNTAVIFPYGKIEIKPDYTWSAASIVCEGGSQVGFASLPYVSGSFTVQSGAAAFITAPSGTLDVTSLIVLGGSKFISALAVSAVSLSVTSGSSFIAQHGLDVATTVAIWGGSHGEAYGDVKLGHEPEVQPGSSWNCDSQQNCYAKGTMILMHGSTVKAIEDIREGDMVFGGRVVNWVGVSHKPAKFVEVDGLTVTDKHLIYWAGFLYQARVIPGVVASDYSGPYYHLQCEKHVPIYANGIVSESFLDVDGYDDMETLSGKRLEKRFTRNDAFAPIVEV